MRCLVVDAFVFFGCCCCCLLCHLLLYSSIQICDVHIKYVAGVDLKFLTTRESLKVCILEGEMVRAMEMLTKYDSKVSHTTTWL